MSDPIRLLIVDDHTLFRRGIVELLNEQPDFLVVGEAGSGREAVQLSRQCQPQVVLMDVHMPKNGGVDTVPLLKEMQNVRVLMLTISDKDNDLIGALAAGADGYLLKSAEPKQLFQAIRQVAAGQGALSPEITARVMRFAATRRQQPAITLSPRERQVLVKVAAGATTAEIATALVISKNTVKTHIRRILKKLDASNRTEAVARATALGLLPPRNH